MQSLAQVVSGIDNAVSNGADVISESFGAQYVPGTADATFFESVDNADVAAGVTVVASAGDSGNSGTVLAPASDPNVIAAAAVDNFRLTAMDYGYKRYLDNNMAALSSAGTAPTNKTVDLSAPGWFGGEAACADGSGGCPPNCPTESMRGTSESAPLIAGAAADLIQAYRDTHNGTSPTPELGAYTGPITSLGRNRAVATTSVPVARRTLIPSSGGSFQTLITSTVGRSIGQVSTYNVDVPAGLSQLTMSCQTADVSADNAITYYLVSPTGTVAAKGTTPDAAGTSPGTVTLTTAEPVTGTWEIDVELGLTESGNEFTQTVACTVTDTG